MTDIFVDELKEWDDRICQFGKKYGLDWYDIDYEIIDYHEMISAMAYTGLPTHYRHWSFGKAYERTHTLYNAGMQGLPYEMIINADPSIAYLMMENAMHTHILTMAHCVGHSDFFKQNRTFAQTDAQGALVRFRSAAKYVRTLIEDPSVGIDQVEKIFDACHAIRYQIPRYPGIKRRSPKELKEVYAQKILDDQIGQFTNFDLEKIPLERDYNVLAFIAEHSRNLKEWQRNLIRISEENSSYFIPQALTKIMNEGWAVLIHEKIIQDLVLPDKYHLPFIKLHNQVIRPHIGQINPYFLGYHLFKEIEKKHGFEECLLVREVHNDATFIRKYLTHEVCDALNLFTYSYKKAKGYKTIDDVSDDMGWENIRDHLIKNIGLGSVPIICVEELTKQHSLILRHEHDGRDLDIPYAKKVHHYIEELWGDEVKLFTILEGDDWEF